MTGMREAGRGGWKVSDIEAATFADDLQAWQRNTNSKWCDIVVASGRKHSTQGWLRDIANGHSPARSNTISEFRGLMTAHPDGIPSGGVCVQPIAKPVNSGSTVGADELDRFASELTEYVRSNSISFSDLARICGYERRCGSWLRDLAKGRTRAKADTVNRIRRELKANPDAQGLQRVVEGRPKAVPVNVALDEPTHIPLHVLKQIEIEANRDAAAAQRRAWIEQQRQAELAKYGRTTIDRDVMDMVA